LSKKGLVKQAYHHKDLRNALIDEALAVLASEEPAELTLRELARRLGVTHTAPYAHFPDKRHLLEAVADEGFARLADRLEAAERASEEPLQAFRAMAHAYLAFAEERPNLYRLMFADPELAHDPESDMSPEGDRALAVVVRAITRIGVPEGVDLRDLAAAIWSSVHGVAMLDLDKRIHGKTMQSPHAVLELGVDITVAGLTALGGGSGA
jgi:AcrR family transcriptional regulator